MTAYNEWLEERAAQEDGAIQGQDEDEVPAIEAPEAVQPDAGIALLAALFGESDDDTDEDGVAPLDAAGVAELIALFGESEDDDATAGEESG